MKKSDRFQSFSKSSSKFDRMTALRKLGVENLEERQLLSASTLAEAAAISDLTSDSAIVAQQDAFAPIDLSNAVGDETPSLVVTTESNVVDATDGLISLQEAVAYAKADPTLGNTITFASNVNSITTSTIVIDFSVNIGDDDTSVTVSPAGSYDVFRVTGSVDVTFNGVSVSNGGSTDGAVSASQGATLTIKNATFSDNSGYRGGALSVGASSRLYVYNSEFVNNVAQVGSVICVKGGAAGIYNSLIADNQNMPIYIMDNGRLDLVNDTIANNGSQNEVAIEVQAGRFAVVNSIVYGNELVSDVEVILEHDCPVVASALSAEMVQALLERGVGEALVACDDEDSVFNDAANGVYTLAPDSIAIDVGDNNYVDYHLVNGNLNLTTDLDGNPRIDNDVIDLGAYEYQNLETPSLVVTTESDVIDATDGLISLREAVAYAKADPSLGDTITFASNVESIALSYNSDAPSNGIVIDFSVNIGDDNTNVTVSSDNNSGIFAVVGSVNVTFNGVSISDSGGWNGVLVAEQGATLTVKNATFSGNSGNEGAAIYALDSTLYVYNSKFLNNRTQIGSAIRVIGEDAYAMVCNSLIADNYGPTIHIDNGFVEFYNVTIANNDVAEEINPTAEGVAIYLDGRGNFDLYNSIVYGNELVSGVDVIIDQKCGIDSSALPAETVQALNEQGLGNALVGINDEDSVFNDAANGVYTLAPDSIAINVGDNTNVGAGMTTDLAGNPRIFNDVVDLGAYEYQGVETPSIIVTTTDDVVDPTDGVISLREAIEVYFAYETRTFDATVDSTGQTVTFNLAEPDDLVLEDGEITIADSMTIYGGTEATITIDGYDASRIFKVADGVNTVEFKGLILQRGKAFANDYVSGSEYDATLETLNGGAIYATTAAITVKNSEIKDSTGYIGGAIFVNGGTLTVSDSIFSENNSAYQGGAIAAYAAEGATALTITGSNFRGNVSDRAGAIYFKDGTASISGGGFAKNQASYASGGAITVANSTTTLTDVEITNNTATRFGGAIFAGNSTVTINNGENVTIEGNSTEYGGAIYGSKSTLNVAGSFTNNKATFSGGAIYAGGDLSVSASFEKNTAGENGGAIYASSALTITDSTFSANGANAAGGAIYATKGAVSVSDSAFDENTSEGSGGAVRIAKSELAAIRNVTFTSNTAVGVGGAIAVSATKEAVFEGNEYTKNSATNSGGAIYATSVTTMESVNGTFDGNTTSKFGGAIAAVNGTDLAVTGGEIKGGSALAGGAIYVADSTVIIGSSATVSGNTASTYGAGVYGVASKIGVIAATITGNTATSSGGAIFASQGYVSLSGATVTDNKSTNGAGGAVSVNAATKIMIKSSTVTGNSAKNSGGAIYAVQTPVEVVEVSNDETVFSNNSTQKFGGAIYVASETLNVASSAFSGNGALSGGAIYATNGEVTLNGVTFTTNTATERGGAIFAVGGSANLTASTFDQNTATEDAGAAYFNGVTATLGEGVSFTGNTAARGGALFSANGTTTTNGVAFVGNEATAKGGAFYQFKGTSTITGGSFETNAAATNGGAVYVGGGASTISGATFTGNTAARGTAISALSATSLEIDGEAFPTSGAIEEEDLSSALLDEAFAELFVEELD